MKKGFVYIMSNKNRTTFYIGVTSDIKRRVLEHKSGHGSIFTSKYILTDLRVTLSAWLVPCSERHAEHVSASLIIG